MTVYFFSRPFGVDGDRTAVPTDTQPSGSVSYQDGFTSDYEKDLGTDPAAKPVPRDQTNQIYYDMTNALNQYQTHGVPDWIEATQTVDGNPYEYDLYARVRYDDGGGFKVYENQVQGNTATPGADETWLVISANTQGVPAGVVVNFASPSAPAGYLLADGSAVSRATYSNLYNAINFTQTGTTTNGLDTVSGLTNATTKMFVGMKLEGTGISAGTTVATIVDDNNITMSAVATASGSPTIKFFPWGSGDGSTTFNLPDLRRRTMIGAGGSGSTVIGAVVGQTGGEEAHTMTTGELVTHSHTTSTPTHQADSTVTSGSTTIGYATNSGTGTSSAVAVANEGNSDPFNVMQPSAVLYPCIKY